MYISCVKIIDIVIDAPSFSGGSDFKYKCELIICTKDTNIISIVYDKTCN